MQLTFINEAHQNSVIEINLSAKSLSEMNPILILKGRNSLHLSTGMNFQREYILC